jgi:lysophospholipase L1-like esterase
MRPSLPLRMAKTGIIACLLGLIPVSAQSPILCIGDSLTTGVGGLESPWPSVLAELSGTETINRGRPGWIPRHLTYAYLLEDCFTLTTDDLRSIPPRAMENRVHQPEINNTRTIIANGQHVIASDATGHRATYRWDAASTASPSASVIQPAAVGNPDHLPRIDTGRWLRLDEPPAEIPPTNRPRICVAWIGANGMESEDVITSLREIETRFKAGGGETFLVLGLLNRMPPAASAKSIAGWAVLIDACNNAIQSDYPRPTRSLDLQTWFTASGPYLNSGYKITDWFPQATAEEIAVDSADQQAGVVPRSLRPPTDKTHLNGTGYTVIGHLVYEALKPHIGSL